MPTTVHIPPRLLAALDRRAKALRVSRNRLVVRSVERELSDRSAWPKEFLARLRDTDAADASTVDDLVGCVKAARRSKAPVRLKTTAR